MNFSNTPLGRFRVIAIAEGISYLVLLFIAMPLKYWAGFSSAVTYTGWVHGLLFILYILAMISAVFNEKWNTKRTIIAFFASLIPFATFVLERTLRQEERMKNLEEERA